jgi:hypothetical protein
MLYLISTTQNHPYIMILCVNTHNSGSSTLETSMYSLPICRCFQSTHLFSSTSTMHSCTILYYSTGIILHIVFYAWNFGVIPFYCCCVWVSRVIDNCHALDYSPYVSLIIPYNYLSLLPVLIYNLSPSIMHGNFSLY